MLDIQLDQVVYLVESLYNPSNSPAEVSQIQKTLQDIQKLDSAFGLADQLLGYPSLNCKFFGALTYTVKLNTSNELSSEDLTNITTKLLQHLINLINDSDLLNTGGLFVIKKLMSNLSLIYIRNFNNWSDPLISLLATLSSSQVTITDSDLSQFMNQSNEKLIGLTIIFSQIITEEIMKKELTNINKSDLHKVVHSNLFATTESLLLSTSTDLGLTIVWVDCLNGWLSYASKAELDSMERYDFIQLLRIVIQLLQSTNNEEHLEKLMDLLIDSLDTNPSFFKPIIRTSLNNLIFGDWGLQFIINNKEDPDTIERFSRLIILFLQIDLVSTSIKLLNPDNDKNFQFLLELTNFPGIPIQEESISKNFIDFWFQLAEVIVEDDECISTVLKQDQRRLAQLHEKSEDLFNQIVHIYWTKIHVPPNVIEFKDEFKMFRRDIGDLTETVFPILKSKLIDNLTNNVLQGLENNQINDIESSLFLLNALMTNFSDSNASPELLSNITKILNTNYLESILSRLNDLNPQLYYLIQTSIQFVSSIDWFYKSNTSYLPQVLSFLFQTMLIQPTATTAATSSFQLTSSKAISLICDDCRLNLLEFLPNFEKIINELINQIEVEPLIRERIINSYASIIQGVKDPSNQGDHLIKILNVIDEKAYQVTLQLDNSNGTNNEILMNYLISLISSVASIGKGMQVPDELEEFYNTDEISRINQYWEVDPLQIHNKILHIISIFELNDNLINNLTIIEQINNIFKSGLTELIKGAFVFKPESILKFIVDNFQKSNYNTYPLLFNLYESLIISHGQELIDSIPSTLQIIFFNRLDVIKSDPDMVQASINLYSSIIGMKPSLIITPNSPDQTLLFNIIEFTITNFEKNEKFVLRSLDLFWNKLINLRKGSRQDHMIIKRLFNETKLGYVLSFNLLKFMILTTRSNLEYFVNIFKILLAKFPNLFKNWLNDAFTQLNNERSINGLNPIGGYEIFIKKLIVTRGNRECKVIIKDFWLSVNGLVNYNKQAT